jgi:hypothetical protein
MGVHIPNLRENYNARRAGFLFGVETATRPLLLYDLQEMEGQTERGRTCQLSGHETERLAMRHKFG